MDSVPKDQKKEEKGESVPVFGIYVIVEPIFVLKTE
jgi:hypothetical protein